MFYRRFRILGVGVAIAIAACTGVPVTSPTKPTGNRKASPSPSSLPSAPAPSASTATATPIQAPSVSPSASVAPILPSASPALSAAHAALRPKLEAKLLAVAKIGFMQGRGQLIGNNSAGIVSQNGAGVISNNAGNLIGNNGSSYRVAQAQADPVISLTPKAGEALAWEHHWDDGRRNLVFNPAGRTTFYTSRQVYVSPEGQAVKEVDRVGTAPDPEASTTPLNEAQTQYFPDGRFLLHMRYTGDKNQQDQVIRLAIAGGESKARDDKAGLSIVIDSLSVDLETGKGTYQYSFPTLGQVEKGTLENFKRGADGKVNLVLLEPHRQADGEARIETTAGALLFTRTTQTEGTKRTRAFDLQDGLEVRVEVASGSSIDRGTLWVDGREEGTVAIERRYDGTYVFTVTFPEAPDAPLVVGYGLGGVTPVSPSPTPTPKAWTVGTLAGGEAGYGDGAADVARFNGLQAIVKSRVTANRYYLADMKNHVVRTMDLDASGKPTFGTYAGGGQAGTADGPRLTARFTNPFGLAVGPDDTLYVSESHRIRKIAPDGTVSVLAGGTALGSADGQGTAAAFESPTGLALADSGDLFVTDFGNSTIRRVTPNGTVTTVAGKVKTRGDVDGAGTVARFNYPTTLAFDGEGRLVVADEYNSKLRRLTADFQVSTLAGKGGDGPWNMTDGLASEAGFFHPRSLALGPDGRLFVGCSNVKLLTADGKIRSYAGLHLTGHEDGAHDVARFTNVRGMVFTPDGTLILTDGTRIRTVKPTGP